MTTYIKLEDIQNHYLTMLGNKYDLDGLNDIMELPSINPESMIKEMIEDELMCECSIARIRTLEDVLSKIKGVPPDRMELS